MQEIIYENKNYNIKQIDQSLCSNIPTMLHTAYFSNMVIMPKCKCHIYFPEADLPAIAQASTTTGYIAIIRKEYKNKRTKRGCVGRILDITIDPHNNTVKVDLEGVQRFISNKKATLKDYPYELIKPSFKSYKNDNNTTPTPINLETVDPVFIQFFLQFIETLEVKDEINFSSLSMDKFINSLIMVMPIRDSERVYLSELKSLKRQEQALALILNCTFKNLTSNYEFH